MNRSKLVRSLTALTPFFIVSVLSLTTESAKGYSNAHEKFIMEHQVNFGCLQEYESRLGTLIERLESLDYDHVYFGGPELNCDLLFSTLDDNIAYPSVIKARKFYYNRSTSSIFGNGSGNPTNSIDPAKSALLPGDLATSANYSNYSRGINGIVIDLQYPRGTPTIDDFRFATWNGIDAVGLVKLPASANPTLTVIKGAGVEGSDRIKIEFTDGVIKNTWLQVTMLASPMTALPIDNVFYFGNAIGDAYLGNVGNPVTVRINATDTSAVRQNQSTAANSVSISKSFDVNKDGRVNATDTSIVRQNQLNSVIKLFRPSVDLRYPGGAQ